MDHISSSLKTNMQHKQTKIKNKNKTKTHAKSNLELSRQFCQGVKVHD